MAAIGISGSDRTPFKKFITKQEMMEKFYFLTQDEIDSLLLYKNTMYEVFNFYQRFGIIPKNEDGSINVKMVPNAIMDVNLKLIDGVTIGYVKTLSGNASLTVCPPAGPVGFGWAH